MSAPSAAVQISDSAAASNIGERKRVKNIQASETGEDVERAVGEIGHPADAEGQIETQGHQRQDDAVDESVNQCA